MSNANNVNIRDIVGNRKLVVYCQQIISISRKMVIGIEGLIRGVNSTSSELIPPMELFDMARKDNLSLELDRACRENILEDFSRVYQDNQDKLLFINLDVAALETAMGSGYLLNQVLQSNINPSNVVIELSEKHLVSNEKLKDFAEAYRQCGFMVALDDVGTGFSNMDRILLLKPDIIKIDMTLVRNIQNDFYKQGVFKSLVILANKIGALVIAEGVETEEEAIQVLRLGGHMIQGYYFSMPFRTIDADKLFSNSKIDVLNKLYNDYMNIQYTHEKNKYMRENRITLDALKRLSKAGSGQFDDVLLEIVSECSDIECAYILDVNGLQISHTVSAGNVQTVNKSLIFYSARKGTDHSMEKYFYPLIRSKRKKYTTEPYISLASGNLCVTLSSVFKDSDSRKYILCLDFKTSEDSYNFELKGPGVDRTIDSDKEIAGILSKMSVEINTDSLTGAFNRRHLNERLLADINNSLKNKQPLSVILFDIDRFKEVNDTYGHLAGDLALKELVSIARGCVRKNQDWVARYGGDEFLVVLVNADEATAAKVAEKLIKTCEKAAISHANEIIGFTVSAGAYTSRGQAVSVDQLIESADKNLYLAKNAGRNRAVC